MRLFTKAGFALSVTLLLFIFSISAFGQGQSFDQVEVQTSKIAENLYMLTGAGGNIGVSVGSDGVLLIDDQFAQLADKIKAAIAGLNGGPVRLVFNSNWHYDHTYGNEWLAKAGALIIAHENSRRHMLSEWSAPELSVDRKFPPFPEAALPKITVADSLTLYFNGDEIRAIHFPNAHSDGDLVFFFKKANVIHTGDVYFSNGFPFINISSGGSINGMITAADKILAMADANTKIMVGHGPVSNREGLKAYRHMLATARDRVAKLVREGKTLEEVVKANPMEGLYNGKSTFPPENFTRVLYLELSKPAK
jgi:glyoxylase-like metal-dependent hydrolase (beta-lactamase superfamily II)